MYVLKVRLGSELKFVSYFDHAAVFVSNSISDAIWFPSKAEARIYAGLIESLCLNLNFDYFVVCPLSVDDEDLVDQTPWFESCFVDLI